MQYRNDGGGAIIVMDGDIPHKLGRYTVLKKLANGGMAEVYLARYDGEEGFSKTVAIKRILPRSEGNAEFIAMLKDEAKALSRVPHQNIVQVFELGREGANFFIAMEFVRGIDLERLMRHAMREGIRVPIGCAVHVIAQILQGLECSHSLDIVHRDISPPNILCSWRGEVKIADFGIAKGAHRTVETACSQLKGKYSYMSPEQASGARVDHRTDIYAAGIILFELLAGSRLYEADDDLAVLGKVRESAIPFERIAHAPAELCEISRTALAREAGDRYGSAEEFLTALNGCAVRRGYGIGASEFGAYLRELFPHEATESGSDAEREPKTAAREPKTAARRATRVMRPGGTSLSALRRAAAALLILTFGFMLPAGVERKADAESTETVAVRGDREEAFGWISVNASPWGLVTIPGYVARREAPVRNIRVKAGDHRIRVVHPPSGKRIAKTITVPAESRKRCFAQLLPASSISCR